MTVGEFIKSVTSREDWKEHRKNKGKEQRKLGSRKSRKSPFHTYNFPS